MTTSTQPTTGGFRIRITRAYADWNIKEEDYKVKGKPVIFDNPHKAHRVVRELMTQDPEDHVLAFEVVEVRTSKLPPNIFSTHWQSVNA